MALRNRELHARNDDDDVITLQCIKYDDWLSVEWYGIIGFNVPLVTL